jgi:arylsulfatase A-like enzyme
MPTILIALLCVCVLCRCGQTTEPPNILLVTLDTTRADRFGSYGYDRPTTPNFDALALDGTLFERAIGVSGCTPPAHASIMTGLYPYHHGLRVIFAGSGYWLSPEFPTLATILAEAGYETGAFLSSFTVSEFFGFDNGFDHWDNGMDTNAEAVPVIREEYMNWDIAPNQRRSDETSRVAANWIRERQRPFFGWVHYWDPHDTAMVPPDDWMEAYLETHPETTEHAIYDLELAYTDENFGRLVSALKESGQYDNTIIIVIADHGQGLGDHDWAFHRLLYQEQIRLPLIIAGPGVAAGTRISEVVSSVDLLPTLVDLLDLNVDMASLDGSSMRGLMHGQPEAPRKAYAEQLNEWDHNSFVAQQRPQDRLLYSVVTQDWKLIHRDTAPTESLLFDLASDPAERVNLFDSPQGAQAQDDLRQWLEDAAVFRRKSFLGETDAEAEERLRSLGYVGGN